MKRKPIQSLGDLVKDLMSGKIIRMTDDKQIDAMKSNLQGFQFTRIDTHLKKDFITQKSFPADPEPSIQAAISSRPSPS
jgi:hypothetical protein